MHRCDEHTACTSCVAQRPAPGVDTGLRCVWCPALGACQEYIKHSFDFPCADAIRGGGGYPGGADCSAAVLLAAARGRPPRSRAQQPAALETAIEPFAHISATAQPVSVVIASFARMANVPHAMHWLWQLEPMHRAASEVIVSHGSDASFAERRTIDESTAALCGTASSRCARVRRVRHFNSSSFNARWFTAHRFFVAAQSANAVVLHLDDDLVPGEAMLQALIDRVALEPGFPLYGEGEGFGGRDVKRSLAGGARPPRPGLYGPSGLSRTCSSVGYKKGGEPAMLTSLAATSRALNRNFVRAFGDFAPLLAATRGNGEDLAFSMFARSEGGLVRSVGSCDTGWTDLCGSRRGEYAYLHDQGRHDADGAFHTRAGHFVVRDGVCRCLAAGHARGALHRCITREAPSDVRQEMLTLEGTPWESFSPTQTDDVPLVSKLEL